MVTSIRHKVSDSPAEPVSLFSLVEWRMDPSRRRVPAPVVLVGNIDDATVSRAARAIVRTPATKRPFIAQMVDLADSPVLPGLATMEAHLRLGAPKELWIAYSWMGIDPHAARLVEALLLQAREQGERRSHRRIHVVSADQIGTVRPVPAFRRVSQSDREEAAMLVQEHLPLVQEATGPILGPHGWLRDTSAAERTVAALAGRGASKRLIQEHLQAYGYLNHRRQVGTWSDGAVAKMIAEVSS